MPDVTEPMAPEDLEPEQAPDEEAPDAEAPAPSWTAEQLAAWIGALWAARRYPDPGAQRQWLEHYVRTVSGPLQWLRVTEAMQELADPSSLPAIVRLGLGLAVIVLGAVVVQPDGSLRLGHAGSPGGAADHGGATA